MALLPLFAGLAGFALGALGSRPKVQQQTQYVGGQSQAEALPLLSLLYEAMLPSLFYLYAPPLEPVARKRAQMTTDAYAQSLGLNLYDLMGAYAYPYPYPAFTTLNYFNPYQVYNPYMLSYLGYPLMPFSPFMQPIDTSKPSYNYFDFGSEAYFVPKNPSYLSRLVARQVSGQSTTQPSQQTTLQPITSIRQSRPAMYLIQLARQTFANNPNASYSILEPQGSYLISKAERLFQADPKMKELLAPYIKIETIDGVRHIKAGPLLFKNIPAGVSGNVSMY